MLTAAEITADYLSRAEPTLTLASSRPAQAYVCLVRPQEMPLLPTMNIALSRAANGTKAREIGLGLSVEQSAADMAIAQILRLEKLDADWDGNDAAKPIDYSLKDARAFIRLLAPESVIPRPALHADGHMILYLREPEIYAELEFLGDQKIGIYARRGEHKWSEEITFDGQSLPDALSQIGFLL